MHGMNRRLLLIAATPRLRRHRGRRHSPRIAPRAPRPSGGRHHRSGHRDGHDRARPAPSSPSASRARARPPSAALAANAAEMRRVIAALKAAGAKDLKTQYVSLSPRYGEQVDRARLRRHEHRLRRRSSRSPSRRGDRRRRRGRREPGLRPVALARRPGRALPRRRSQPPSTNARASAEALAGSRERLARRVTAIVEGGGMPPPMPLTTPRTRRCARGIAPRSRPASSEVSAARDSDLRGHVAAGYEPKTRSSRVSPRSSARADPISASSGCPPRTASKR